MPHAGLKGHVVGMSLVIERNAQPLRFFVVQQIAVGRTNTQLTNDDFTDQQ